MKYISKNLNIIIAVLLFIMCFVLYFINMGNYAFIDTNETKFVSIAKEMLNYNDWINIKLNGKTILNIQPLYFWIVNTSCFIMGKISITSARLPIAIVSAMGIFSLFYTVRVLVRRTYAFLISSIYALSIGIIIFSRLATNDIFSSVLIMLTILPAYLLIFTRNDKYKPILRLCIYIFCAFSILSGGLFGFFIPFFAITAMLIFSGQTKKLLPFKSFLIGIIIIFTIAAPWNILMIHKHGLLFIKEFLNTYNFIKYSGFKETIYAFCLFFILFLPWSFSFIWILGRRFKQIVSDVISYFKENSEDKLHEKWKKLKQIEKFISLNTIVFFTSLIFALIFGAEHIYLILLLIFPASCLAGYYWYDYIIKKRHDKSIFFATLIPDLILIIISLAALFGHNILNQWIFKGLNYLITPLIIIFFIIPVIGILAVILKGRLIVFLSNIILMFSLSFVITPHIFNFITLNSGENDLISYAGIANKDKVSLASFTSSKKYSLVYYYDDYVIFYDNKDLNKLKNYMLNHPKDYIIAEIKDLWDVENAGIKYMLLDAGKRYCLIQYMNYDIQKLEDNEEPELILY